MQSNWIGKSVGAEIDFKYSENEKPIKIMQQDQILFMELLIAL